MPDMGDTVTEYFATFARDEGLDFKRFKKYWRIRIGPGRSELLQGFPHRDWVRGFFQHITAPERHRLRSLSEPLDVVAQPQYVEGVRFHISNLDDCRIVKELVLDRLRTRR